MSNQQASIIQELDAERTRSLELELRMEKLQTELDVKNVFFGQICR